ncbi:hypothetical protein [Paenibacillus sp. LHD-38]|uniref:hypothetical protein n=1 Tax=Paenibacillus sp. LHD-38 TaxID=3072143 RepID=UPI00280FD643|nr:hypothetical protein [Paenibacillus sp. LHD-38]MDQ8739175.1 hypothetical protein [Paenibacillus sp. LHD-38]
MKIGKKSYIVVFAWLVFVTGIALYSELGVDYPNNYGTTVSENDYLVTASEDVPDYPVNEQGQTYGNGPFPPGPVQEPDLIGAEGVDGTMGYVLRKDLVGEQPNTPEEALAIQKSRPPGGHDIPLYDVDGKTVIGVFHIGGN